MKRMEIFCSSPASTAICSSIDQRSMVRQSHKTSLLEKHHLQQQQQQQSPRTSTSKTLDHQRVKVNTHHRQVPCSSHLPINPTPLFENGRRSTSTSCSIYKKSSATLDSSRRKSSADIYDLKLKTRTKNNLGDNICLLSETPSFVVDWLPESSDGGVKAANNNKGNFRSLSTNSNVKDSSPLLRSSSSSTRSRHHQVVVLRVSLHCKGCEGKVKKHLSKMEGVRSFSIDLASKKVTVIGDVTPLGVLQSVSKVKNAQLWPSPTSSPSSPWSA